MNDSKLNRGITARLSRVSASDIEDGAILVMVGSYAPAHEGHVAAMTAALTAIESSGEKVACLVYVPNGDSYVSFKLHDAHGTWNYERRISILLDLTANSSVPALVDDMAGARPIIDKSSTRTAITMAARHLGIDDSRFVVVVGSDQVASMKPYVTTNRAVCVIRPGAVAQVLNMLREEWFYHAIASGRYLFTERDNPYEDISSTQLRQAAQNLEIES